MQLPLWLVGLDLVIASAIFMTLWYVMGQYAKRIDLIDAGWALLLVYLSGLALMLHGSPGVIEWVVFGFVAVWGLRLFWHIAARLQASSREDARYAAYREKWGSSFAVKSFFRLFMVQALLAVLVTAPVVAVVTRQHELITWVAAVGFGVWGLGIVFEAVADLQLSQFLARKAGRQPDDIMDKGLWKYSRHPNYFGEIMAWTGAAIVALSASQWWGLLGPVVLTIALVKISGIPPIEKRYRDNKKYQDYKAKTSALIPLPPKS